MKKNNLFKIVLNPFIGPIVMASIIIGAMIFFYIPKASHDNQIESLKNEALTTIDELKKTRSYYTNHIINVIKNNPSEVKINFDHAQKSDTIPLPATLLHNLSEILPENEITIKMFSHYPFPNRADRKLTNVQEEALKFVEKNPHDTFTKVTHKENTEYLSVAVSDIFYDQGCVNCHNTRADTPKNDWKLGDVRGAIQVTLPINDSIVLNSEQTIFILSILVVLILILGVHYAYVSFKQKNYHKDTKSILEKQIESRTKTLNEYKKAVDSSAIVSKTDAKGKITYVNDEFIKISGYSEDELLGKNHNLVRHPDMPDEIFKDLWDTIKSKKIWKGQIKNRAKDGTSYYVASTIVPITDENDNIAEFLAIRLNISSIVESKMEAEKADMTKSTFLANMSHEIRTPLNAIIGFSQVLSQSKDLNIESKKQAQIIESSANSLLMIINDILDISKIESGNFQVNIANSDLYFIGEHVVELFTKKATQKNIKLIFNMDQRIPLCIQTDGTRIRQVISNLISNAIKFTEAYGSVYLNILSLEEKENKAMIRFEIIDSGIGIPEDKLESIFDPFIQVDSQVNRKYEGTGLGLSICSHIVETFGSKIYAQSKEGEGTRFWFDLWFDTCEDVFFEKSHYLRDISFGIIDNENDLYHFAKRYLSILGKINFDADINSSDVVVLYFTSDLKEEFEKQRNTYDKPKLILVEYENDLKKLTPRSDEVAVALPFYPSKLNDAVQELVNHSSQFESDMKKSYSYNGKVLVAEDNFANQELITFILKSVGVEFDIASNGKEALNLYMNNSYDIVLMDINMPIMDGIESLKYIRKYEKENQKSYTPVVALTANAIKGDKEKFLSLGMDDYMSKPIEMEKLKGVFDQYLEEKIENNEDKANVEEKIEEKANEEEEMMALDASKVANALGVSENIAKMLIVKFKKEIPNDLEELGDFIRNGDLKQVKQKAHFIKNSCLNLGLKEECESLQSIETELHEIEALKKEFQSLQQRILNIV